VKTVHIALAPISAIIWGYDQIKEFVSTKVAEKLIGVSVEKIQTPDLTVAGPTLDALRYTGHKEDLRELYANLLANAINIDTAKSVHPGFVDIIKNLTSDEARILIFLSSHRVYPIVSTKAILKDDKGYKILLENVSMLGTDAKCQNPEFSPKYIDNLIRLGLLVIPPLEHLTTEGLYDAIFNHPTIQKQKTLIEQDKGKFLGFEIEKKFIKLTAFGLMFATACIYPPKVPQK